MIQLYGIKAVRVIFVCLALVLLAVTPAVADLLISPLQVVIEGRERSTRIVLVNTGNNKNTYRLEWLQLEQASHALTGGYQEEKNTAGQTHLKDIAVFTPRQITLDPKEKQTVRLAVRRPADLPDGEYKSHLKFKITKSEAVSKKEPKKVADNAFSAQVQVLSSYSIPAIYRVGDYDCNVTIGRPRFDVQKKTGNMSLTIPLSREGIHGAVGLVEVYHRPQGGDEVLLGTLGNVNFFPEISEREAAIYTNVKGLAAGDVRIVFKRAEGKIADYVVMDEKIFPVAN